MKCFFQEQNIVVTVRFERIITDALGSKSMNSFKQVFSLLPVNPSDLPNSDSGTKRKKNVQTRFGVSSSNILLG